MSFNVYTGIKFRTKNIETALTQLKSIRAQALKNMANSLLRGNFYGLASKMSKYLKEDIKKYKEDPSEMNLLAVKLEIIQDLHRIGDNRENARLNCELDYPFEIIIYPYHKNLYGNYFGTQHCPENEKLLTSVVDEYWYGDQGDPDPNIPTRQWNQRRKIWNGIYEVDNYPTQIGVSFMIAKWDWLEYSDISDELVKRLANLKIFDKNYEESEVQSDLD